MEIQLKYFGAIAEITKLNAEVWNFEFEQISIQDFTQKLIAKYNLSKTTFSIALNKKMAQPSDLIQSKDELAILPPFAGG